MPIQFTSRALVLLALGGVTASSFAATPAVRYPLTLAMVARAVVTQHPELANAQISMPVTPHADAPEPRLAVAKPEPWPGAKDRERVRIGCVDGGCLPFYVDVRLSAPGQALTVLEAATASPSEEASAAMAATPVPLVVAPRLAANITAKRPLVRAGDRAELTIDSGVIHLRVPVTCLEPGEAGSVIRVAGPGRRVVYSAEVLDKTTVRGSL